MLRRTVLFALSALPLSAWALLRPRPALAIPVIDAAGVAQVIAQITSTIAQIEQTRRQVEYLRNAAKRLDPRSYRTIGALLEGDAITLDAITRDIDTIGYTVESVNRRFKRIFPDEGSVEKMRLSEHADTSRQMNRELHGAALASHRAQTNISNLEESHAQAKAILDRSAANDSQVAQLQSANQMLALVHANLVNITQTVATAGRVTSDIAATRVTENRIAAERRRRRLDGFGRPATSRGIDPAFLRD